MFTPIQQSTAWPPLLRRLELLPGVTTLFRDHGRPILGTLVTFQLFYLFLLSVEYFNCWSEETQVNIYRHLFQQVQVNILCSNLGGMKVTTTNRHRQHQNNTYSRSGNKIITEYKLRPSSRQQR